MYCSKAKQMSRCSARAAGVGGDRGQLGREAGGLAGWVCCARRQGNGKRELNGTGNWELKSWDGNWAREKVEDPVPG